MIGASRGRARPAFLVLLLAALASGSVILMARASKAISASGEVQVTPPQTLYVADPVAASVLIFSTSSTGNAVPSGIIASSAFAARGPHGIALDGSGNIWVSDDLKDDIYEFAAGTTGNPTYTGLPNGAFGGPNTGLSSPHNIVFDSAGNLWGVNSNSNSIFEFSAGQVAAIGNSGNVIPAVTISGVDSGINNSPYGIAIDSAGDIVVTQQNTGGFINVYAPGSSGDATPLFKISDPSIANGEYGIAIDSAGNYWVNAVQTTGNFGQILEFDPSTCFGRALGSVCAISPIKTISAPADPSVVTPVDIAIDASGNLWVGND